MMTEFSLLGEHSPL